MEGSLISIQVIMGTADKTGLKEYVLKKMRLEALFILLPAAYAQ